MPHALNELDDPVAVAVDSFGSVYIADLAGRLQRVISNCALSTPFFGAVSRVASDAQGHIYFSDPQHSAVWGLPAAPPPRRRGRHAKPGLRRPHQRCQLADVRCPVHQPASAVCPDLRHRTRRDGAYPRGVSVPLRPRSGAIRFHRHRAHNLAGTSVYSDQTAAPLILAQAGEIWAVVPATIAGQSSNVTIRSKRISEHCYRATRTYRLRAEAA